MNQPSSLRQSQRLVKIQHSYPYPTSETTPKKEYQDSHAFRANDQSTLQKIFSFGPEEYQETLRKDKKKPKRPWTPEQDILLKDLVHSKGPKEWAFISSYFNERCGKQCRERWHNHLRNGIKKGDWTYEEQWYLFLGVYAYGKRWSIISKYLEGRTENTLKNHWNCKMKPKKENLSKKLSRFLHMNARNFSKTQALLVKLIKERSFRQEEELQNESQNTRRIIKLFKGVINNFLESKKSIYEPFETQSEMVEVKIEEEFSAESKISVAFKNVEDELKDQNVQMEKEKFKDLKLEILAIENEFIYQNHTFGMMNDFGSDSNSLNMRMNGLMKEVSEVDEKYDQMKSQEFEVEVGEWSENESESEDTKRRDGESGQFDRFGSPLRRNIFAGMDLEASIKKKLFESGEKENSKKESQQM